MSFDLIDLYFLNLFIPLLFISVMFRSPILNSPVLLYSMTIKDFSFFIYYTFKCKKKKKIKFFMSYNSGIIFTILKRNEIMG